MPNIFAIKAELRTETGKSASKKLKDAGQIPAIIYGPGKEPKSIAVDFAQITKRHKQGRFYTQVCEVEVGGKKIQVIPKDLYRHPVTDNVEHVDFYELDDKIRVKIKGQIVLRNEEKCLGVKQGGVVSQSVRRIELSCFPKDIVSEIEVDITDLELGSSYHISDLKLPEGVEVTSKVDQAVVAVIGRMAEIVDDEPEDEGAEGEEGAEGAAAEGEKAEGGEAPAEEKKEG